MATEAFDAVIARCRISGDGYCAVPSINRVGRENAVTFYGSSFICDPLGNVLAQASRDKDEVIHAALRADLRTQYHELFPLLHRRRPQHYAALLDRFESPPLANIDL